MSKLYTIANNTIKPPKMLDNITFNDGVTVDIITQILDNDKTSFEDTARFAPYLKGDSIYKTCSNIWHFVKDNITYKLDPIGVQYVKTPARTWRDKTADCKSYSIFIASILKNLGINYKYRFVSFSGDPVATHVYIVVPTTSGQIIIDDVLPAFNTEKPYTHKFDYDMTQIHKLSGIGQQPKRYKKIIDLGSKPLDEISEAEMDLRLLYDAYKTDKAHIDRIKGIGNIKSEHIQDRMDVISDMICAIDAHEIGSIGSIEEEIALIYDQAKNGMYTNAHKVSGIGSNEALAFRRKQQMLRQIMRRNAPKHVRVAAVGALENEEIGNLFKKVFTAVKSGAKAVSKTVSKAATTVAKGVATGAKAVAKGATTVAKKAVKIVTAPIRLVAKGVLEITLPKASPFFLYTFLTDAQAAKAPAKVRAKRDKANKIKRFVIDAIGMKEAHFNQIIRNGIKKQTGKTPETLLAAYITGKVSGIGFVALIPIVMELIQQIAKLFGKKFDGNVTDADAPADSDFASTDAATQQQLTNSIRTEDAASTDPTLNPELKNGVKSSWKSF